MTDLYSDLGVEKSSSLSDIRKAYKRKAQKNHPDKKGGDTKEFQRIQKAYSILSDEAKRSNYDQTGSSDEPAQDSEIGRILRELATLLNNLADNAGDYENILEKMRFGISGVRANRDRDIGNLEVRAQRRRKLAAKFKVKSGENFLQDILLRQVQDIERQIIGLKEMYEFDSKVLEFLANYDFDNLS